MNEEILLRYFNRTASNQEQEMVFEWAHSSNEAREEFARLKNLYVSQSMPCTKASKEEYKAFLEMAARTEYSKTIPAGHDKAIPAEHSHLSVPAPKRNNTFRIFQYSAAAVIILLLALNLEFNWLALKPLEKPVRISQLAVEEIHSLYTERGVKGSVTLPDGSKVWLNSDSRITYPKEFSGPSREVDFTGEGYFEVVKDSLCPMIVHCNKDFKIEVYGTNFNVKTYDNDNIAQTTLYSGHIRLVSKLGVTETITQVQPNEAVLIAKAQKPKVVTVNKPQTLSKWKDGELIFASTPLEDAARILERWHGGQVIIANKALNKIPITAKFKTESLVQIMELLKFSMDIDYKIENNVVTIM